MNVHISKAKGHLEQSTIKWFLGGQRSISSCQHHFVLRQVPETAWSNATTKDVWLTRRSPRTISTFYILRRRLFRVLFTCMASRAVHIETANSLETDAFINASRRFICCRGLIRQLRGDPGTNFVGAHKELGQALAEMDQDKIRTKLLEEQCDWISFKMNVPAASHMGGVWERQIRSARNVLSSLRMCIVGSVGDELPI